MNPEQWLANFESQISDLKQKAAAFQENLEHSTATVSSKDGRVTLSVAPNGSLTDLRIADNPALATEIMTLARQAQRQAAAKVAEAVTPLAGDSEALHMITGYVPPEEPEVEQAAPNTYRIGIEEEPPTAPPPRPPVSRTRPDDDDDFGYKPDDRRW